MCNINIRNREDRETRLDETVCRNESTFNNLHDLQNKL